jgi:ABC-2 type transport system permease protein
MLPLTIANLKIMVRNRHTTFWALLFPLLLVAVFGLFDIDNFGSASIAVIDDSQTPRSQSLAESIGSLRFLSLEATPESFEETRGRLEEGELDYLILIPEGFGTSRQSSVSLTYSNRDPDRNQLVETAINSLVMEARVSSDVERPGPGVVSEEVSVAQVSYFDVVLLGLVGLGTMTNSIISIAVKISTYRNQSILKRMLVTPLAIWKYFAAEIVSHLVLALVQAAIILSVGVFIFGAQIHGNLLWLMVIVLMGSLIFLNIGFILSAWANTPSAASGMGNAIALPMIFFAGTFFSTASLPWFLPQVVQALPLTPMLSAMREVAIDSAPIWEVWPQLAALGGWMAATALTAVRVFRFS